MHAVVKGLVYGTEDVQWVEEYDMDWGNKPFLYPLASAGGTT